MNAKSRGKVVESTPFGERSAALDGIRGIAILLVLVYHTAKFEEPKHAKALVTGTAQETLEKDEKQASGLSEEESDVPIKSPPHAIDYVAYQAAHAMWCGVDLFFVLSGFLITGILLDSRGGERYFTNFYMRRTLRIFPLYYGLLILLLVVIPLGFWLLGRDLPAKQHYDLLLKNQLWAWTYTANFLQAFASRQLPGMGHFWSLAIEEQFYMMWPLIVYLLAPKRLLKFSLGVVVAVFAIRFAMHINAESIRTFMASLGYENLKPHFIAPAIRQLTFTRVDDLVMGGIGAIIIRDKPLLARIKPLTPALLVFSLAGIAGVWAWEGVFAGQSPAVYLLGFSLLGIFFCTCLVRIASGLASPLTIRCLESSWLCTMGRYSYGVYMFHWPIKFFVVWLIAKLGLETGDKLGTSMPDAFLKFALSTAFSLGVAFVSWHLWETQWLKLKKYFSYKSEKDRRAKAAEVAAAPAAEEPALEAPLAVQAAAIPSAES